MWAASGTAAVVLAVLTVGVPGALILVGAWLLAAALGRAVPKVSGTVSWAAAIVLQAVLLTGLSAAVALASPRPHGRLVNLAVLAGPVVLGLAAWLIVCARDGQRQVPRYRSRSGLAIATIIAGLGLTRYVASRGTDYGVAWAMGGDARNHILITRSLLTDGGLTARELRAYPAIVNNVIALISGAGGRSGLPPGQLMLHDARALAATYVLAGIAVALMLVAALIELLPRALARDSRLPPSVVVILFACAVTSASPLLLGTGLDGGFVTAYAALPIAIASIVLALRFCSEPSPVTFALLGPATTVLLFAWSPLAVVPIVLLVLVTLVGLTRFRRVAGGSGRRAPTWDWVAAAVVSLGALLITLGAIAVGWSRLRAQFSTTGSITTPQSRVMLLLGLVALAASLAARGRARRLQLVVPLVVAVAGGITVRWLASLSSSAALSYYAAKSLWLFASCLVWVAFAPALLLVTDEHRAECRSGKAEVARVVQAAAWSGVALIVLGFTTTVTDPLPAARTGWEQPAARTVAETVAAADKYRDFVLWEWSPGHDRLGNFWAALAWDSTPSGTFVPHSLPFGSLAAWAYVETGAISNLCTVVRAVPHIAVITRNPNLASQLRKACPHSGARIVDSS